MNLKNEEKAIRLNSNGNSDKWSINIIPSGPQIIDKKVTFYIKDNEISRKARSKSKEINKFHMEPIRCPNKKKTEKVLGSLLIDVQITEKIQKGKSFEDIWGELEIDEIIKK